MCYVSEKKENDMINGKSIFAFIGVFHVLHANKCGNIFLLNRKNSM